jgi:glycosyltransferase involved in cell wall biosynthesis
MKLAWIIQGPPHSAWSYFVQARLAVKELNRYGHTSQLFSFTDIKKDAPFLIQSIKEYQPKWIINLGDVHLLDLAHATNTPLISIVTNGTGMTELTGPVPCVTFACTTRYAQTVYANAGIHPIPYLPHGFDPSIFYPGNRKQARKKLGWLHPNPVILMLGTNYLTNPQDKKGLQTNDRKNFTGALTAFMHAQKIRPEVKLYLHTNAIGAVNLPQTINAFGLSSSVILGETNNLQSQKYLANLYQASNLLLFPSIGESFGLPVIEAQACGLPVVATHTGPIPELVFTGTTVKTKPHPTIPGWGIPDTDSLAQALLQWLDNKPEPITSKAIRTFTMPNIIKNHFLPILERKV